MSKYMKHGMKLIYLDQCATSEIYRDPNGKWAEIRSLLHQGVKKKRLMCPRSIEHFIETSSLADGQAIALDDELHQLSFGRSFLPEADTAAMQLVASVRGKRMTIDDFTRKNDSVNIRKPGVLTLLRDIKEQFDETIENVNRPVNLVRKLSRGQTRLTDDVKKSMVGIIKDQHKQQLVERLTPLSLGIVPEVDVRNVGGLTVPDWAGYLCILAVRNHGFSPNEAETALNIIRAEGIDAVPTVTIRAEIAALVAVLNVKDEPRDQWDIMRIASTLPYADVMVTDGGRQAEMRQLNLDRRFECEVFATRRKEQERLSDFLHKLVHPSSR